MLLQQLLTKDNHLTFNLASHTTITLPPFPIILVQFSHQTLASPSPLARTLFPNSMPVNAGDQLNPQWRQPDRIKTVAGVLCLCLHIGTPPPDQINPSLCARLECWLDPLGVPAALISNEGSECIDKLFVLYW